MSLAIAYSRAKLGVQAPLVTVEIHLSNGLPSLNIVGLPEMAVKESKDRVRSAIINSGFEFPTYRIIVNLAPADLPKEGGRYDLAIALGILAASGQIPAESLSNSEWLGELALSGQVRSIQGALPAAMACHSVERHLWVPAENAQEAALANSGPVMAADNLLQICQHLHGVQKLTSVTVQENPAPSFKGPDLADVIGQEGAKRALLIAAAGGHNLLMIGPPGSGKTMLASRLAGLLPPLSNEQALEVAAVQSISGHFNPHHNWRQRPFRTPHHTASAVSLVGGGSYPKPGEISLAHHGVLFLDELPEYQRNVLEVLREPLESGHITISRVQNQIQFPSRFQLVAAMNPCPCGHYGNPLHHCRCTPDQVQRYRGKLSAPLLDRIDLQIEVPALPYRQLTQTSQGETERETVNSAEAQQRVMQAYQRQQERAGKNNSQLNNRDIDNHCTLLNTDQDWLIAACEKLGLSVRSYHRLIKVARTIADLQPQTHIDREHLREALAYRCLDKGSVQSRM